MIGNANDIYMLVFGSTSEFEEWKAKYGEGHVIIDVKFGMLPQSVNYQYSYGILIIFKESQPEFSNPFKEPTT